jgi:tyrosine-protein kinase Etk/Wzc
MSTENAGHSTQSSNTISLLDLIAVFLRHKWLILITTFLAAVLIVLYSFYTLRAPPDGKFNYLPNYFRPITRVRLLDEEQSSISSALSGSDLGLLATLAGTSAGGSSSAELAQTLLVGNRILDDLIEEFDIIEKLNITEYPRSSSRVLLRNGFETEFDAATGILTIGFQSVDKVFATEILTSAVGKLEAFFDELTLRGVLVKKQFLEESIAGYESELEAAQQTLINFQARNNIIDIRLQTQYQLNSLASLEGQILVKETELGALSETRRTDDPEVLRVTMELNLLKTRRDITKLGQRNAEDSLEIPLAQLPELSAVYANLLGDIEILQLIYSTLRSQYESVKIEEKDNSERFQVIEDAEIPERKAGPSRGKICIVVTLSAFLASVLIAFFLDYLKRVKADPTESEKLAEIRRMLHRRRRKSTTPQ